MGNFIHCSGPNSADFNAAAVFQLQFARREQKVHYKWIGGRADLKRAPAFDQNGKPRQSDRGLEPDSSRCCSHVSGNARSSKYFVYLNQSHKQRTTLSGLGGSGKYRLNSGCSFLHEVIRLY